MRSDAAGGGVELPVRLSALLDLGGRVTPWWLQHVAGGGWVARLADLFPVRHILQVVLRSFSVPGALVAVRRFRWS